MYRVDKNEYSNGDEINHEDTYYHEYSDRPVEKYLEKYRPEEYIRRSECVFTFWNLKDALLFDVNKLKDFNTSKQHEQFNIYEVKPLNICKEPYMFRGDFNITEYLYLYIKFNYQKKNIEPNDNDEFIKFICESYWGQVGSSINYQGYSPINSCIECLTQGVKVISKVANYDDISKFRDIYYNNNHRNYLNFENYIYEDLLRRT